MNPASPTSTAARSGGDASKFALHPGANEIYEGMIDLALRPAVSWEGPSPRSANGRRPSLSKRRSVGCDTTPFVPTNAPEEYDNNSRNNSRSNIKKDSVVDLLRDLVWEVRQENDDGDGISPPVESNGREGGEESSNNSMSSAALALMDLSSCNDLDSGASSADSFSFLSGGTTEYDDFGEGGEGVLPFPAPLPLAPPRRHSSLLPPRFPLRRYDRAFSTVNEEDFADNGRAASPTSPVGREWREVNLWGGEANSESKEEGSPRTSPRNRCLALKLNPQASIGSIRLLKLPSASRLPGRFARSA